MFAIFYKHTPNTPVTNLSWERTDDFDNGQEMTLVVGWTSPAIPPRLFETPEDARSWLSEKLDISGGRPAWAAPYEPWPADFEIRQV